MAEQGLDTASAAHWVVRFAPVAQRQALTAAWLFDQELAGSVARCTDAGATRLKLDWWRQALARADDSAHPLVQRLAPLATVPAGLAAMQSMLDAAEYDILRRRPDDAEAFHEHCTKAGALARLLAVAAGASDGVPAAADTLGRYARAVERIQQLGRRLQRDHTLLPIQGAPAGALARWSHRALAECCESLLMPLRADAEPLLRDRTPQLGPVRRWAAQARAVHRLLAREDYPVREQFLDITPLSRLWAAWRVR